MMFKEFNTFIQPFRDKLENLLKYGKTTRISGTNGALQKIQLSTLRNIEDALKIGQFGFNSKMPNGSRVVVAEISNEKIIIANEHIASIIDVTDGNTIIYNQSGSYIKLENDTITFNSTNIVNDCTNYTVNASSSFTVNSPSSSFDGGTVTNDSVSIDKTHVHLKSGGSSTQPPTP